MTAENVGPTLRDDIEERLRDEHPEAFRNGFAAEDVWDMPPFESHVGNVIERWARFARFDYTVDHIDPDYWDLLKDSYVMLPWVVCDDCTPLAHGGYAPCEPHQFTYRKAMEDR